MAGFLDLKRSRLGLGSKSCILLLLLCSSVYATSDCVVGAVTTCKCEDGTIEYYRSYSEELKEAVDDPTSCCYYDPAAKEIVIKIKQKQDLNTYNVQDFLIKPVIMRRDVEVEKPLRLEDITFESNDVEEFVPKVSKTKRMNDSFIGLDQFLVQLILPMFDQRSSPQPSLFQRLFL